MSQPDKHPEGAPQDGAGGGPGVPGPPPGHDAPPAQPGPGLPGADPGGGTEWPMGRPAGGPGGPVAYGGATPGRGDGAWPGSWAGGWHSGRSPGRAGGRRVRDRGGDLAGAPFPQGDWGDPAARLSELYRWAEQDALRTADWYLADRTWKRRGARAARALTLAGVAVAVALPLLTLTGVCGGSSGAAAAVWGYVGLLAAALGAGLDRWFGLTSGWMRDVATAQAVRRRLEALRFDWASESAREVLGPAEGTAGEAAERCLMVLRRFCEDVSELVRGETADWMVEFHAGGAQLRTQSVVSWARREEGRAAARFPLPPTGRPSMPRQRPPEGFGGR